MTEPRAIGRYQLYRVIASGGTATVHLGRLEGPAGFSKTVAVKRLHPHFATDPEFVAMLLDEARLAAHIQHPNVVSTLDVVAVDDELILVMEYVRGGSLSLLLRRANARGERIPPAIVVAIMSAALYGLHAAHEAKNQRGEPLGIVHRDISPQNVLVGTDGVARVADFGIAKAVGRIQTTREGQIKGKYSYMAPEQLRLSSTDSRTDVYAAAVVTWEALTSQTLFRQETPELTAMRVFQGAEEPPSRSVPELPAALDAVVMRGLAAKPSARFHTAREMAIALEEAHPAATTRQVGEWVERLLGEELEKHQVALREIDSDTRRDDIEPLGDAQPITTLTANVERTAKSPARRWQWLGGIAGVLALGVGFFLLGRNARLTEPTTATAPISVANVVGEPPARPAPAGSTAPIPAASLAPESDASVPGRKWSRTRAPAASASRVAAPAGTAPLDFNDIQRN